MSTIQEVVSRIIAPYKTIIISLIIFILFAVFGYYMYTQYGSPIIEKKNADIYNATDPKEATVYFFYADWCPHCKNAKPSWEEFKNNYEGKTVNGYKLNIVSVNCTKAEDPETANMIDRYDIKSYPTIKIQFNDKIYEFDAKITPENLAEFVHYDFQK
jgi:thiol-disulfide isomerase/thioredoxin